MRLRGTSVGRNRTEQRYCTGHDERLDDGHHLHLSASALLDLPYCDDLVAQCDPVQPLNRVSIVG
jgi:hypothetical protein